MLRFIVMRHAKSVSATGEQPDHARPLNGRGRRDAPAVARVLATRGWTPERVLCSDSARTRETWAHMAPHLVGEAESRAPEVRFLRELYLPTVADFEAVLRAGHEDARTLLTVAHNPGCEDLVKLLADRLVVMKTSFAVLMSAEAPSWSEAFRPGGFSIVDVIGPPPRHP